MRIIAGKLKGATLHMLKDKDTRPLKDLARESIFNLLTHSNKISLQLEQSNILDLYAGDRKSTRLNSSHALISYAVFCLKKKKTK